MIKTVKLCECGCGNPAPIAKRTRSKNGHKKGEPIRFIKHHATKTRINHYIKNGEYYCNCHDKRMIFTKRTDRSSGIMLRCSVKRNLNLQKTQERRMNDPIRRMLKNTKQRIRTNELNLKESL